MSRRHPNRPTGKELQYNKIGDVIKKPTVYTIDDMMMLVNTMRSQAEMISDNEHMRICLETNKIIKKHNKYPKTAMKKLKELCSKRGNASP